MRKLAGSIVLAACVSMLCSSGPSGLQAAAKPAAKKPAASTNKATMGTTQLKGDHAVIGTTYTLGKTSPINFTLRSVEYRTDQVFIENVLFYPKADEKLMVLRYTLHNPQKRDYHSYWGSLTFTAVDANDTNWKYHQSVGVDGKNAKMNMKLKPAQKTNAYTVIRVPAAGQIPKLIVESQDHLVLRYDLRGKVKPLPAPFADPADETGATALAEVPAKTGEYYPMKAFDLKLDKVELADGPLGSHKARENERFLIATCTAKKKGNTRDKIVRNTFTPLLIDGDGVKCNWTGEVIRATRDEKVPPIDVEPGQEFTFRYFFRAPGDMPLKSLTIGGGADFRSFVFDMSDVK